MKKGILELCILFGINKKDMYGYEIMKIIGPEFQQVKEAVIYSILRRICKNGYSETYIVESPNGPKRKYYKITTAGKSYLAECIAEWRQIKKAADDFGIK